MDFSTSEEELQDDGDIEEEEEGGEVNISDFELSSSGVSIFAFFSLSLSLALCERDPASHPRTGSLLSSNPWLSFWALT